MFFFIRNIQSSNYSNNFSNIRELALLFHFNNISIKNRWQVCFFVRANISNFVWKPSFFHASRPSTFIINPYFHPVAIYQRGGGGEKKSSLLSKETRRTRQIPIKTPSPFPSTYTKSQKPRRRFEGSLVSKERRERENGETKVKEFGGEWGEEEERRCFERAVDATLGNRVPAVFVPIVTSPHRCTWASCQNHRRQDRLRTTTISPRQIGVADPSSANRGEKR